MISAFLTHPGGVPLSVGRRAVEAIEAARGSVERREADADWPTTLLVAGLSVAQTRDALRPIEGEVDVLVTSGPEDAPRLLVADMDSTMVGCECLDELADYAGLKAAVAAITERAMQGQLDFAASLKERVKLLAGLPVADIALCLAARVRPNPGARTLVATLKAHRIRTVLVTGGFTAFAEPVAAELGFDRVVANRLEVERDRLTGRVLGPIVDAAAKRAVLIEEAAALGGRARALAVGDGANDIPMLDAAGLGVAYKGKPTAAAAAAARIAHGDLTSLLPAFGIARSRWAPVT